jgi:hypothetical protein
VAGGRRLRSTPGRPQQQLGATEARARPAPAPAQAAASQRRPQPPTCRWRCARSPGARGSTPPGAAAPRAAPRAAAPRPPGSRWRPPRRRRRSAARGAPPARGSPWRRARPGRRPTPAGRGVARGWGRGAGCAGPGCSRAAGDERGRARHGRGPAHLQAAPAAQRGAQRALGRAQLARVVRHQPLQRLQPHVVRQRGHAAAVQPLQPLQLLAVRRLRAVGQEAGFGGGARRGRVAAGGEARPRAGRAAGSGSSCSGRPAAVTRQAALRCAAPRPPAAPRAPCAASPRRWPGDRRHRACSSTWGPRDGG